VQQLEHQIAQHIIFINVIGVDFGEHFVKNGLHRCHLLVREFKNPLARRLKNRILVQVAELMEKLAVFPMLLFFNKTPPESVMQVQVPVKILCQNIRFYGFVRHRRNRKRPFVPSQSQAGGGVKTVVFVNFK
jgi:hypothetical protein